MELITICELVYAAGYTASDCYVGRFYRGENLFLENELIVDLSGGIPATFPHLKDFLNPDIKD